MQYSVVAFLSSIGLLQTTTFAQVQPAKVYDLPSGIAAPYRVGICADEGPLLFWSKDSSQSRTSTLYSFDLGTKTVRQLLKGTYGDILCSPRRHILCVQLRKGDATTLVVLNDNGEKIGELKNPENGAFFFPRWTADGNYIVYEGSDPENSPKDVDAFNAIGVLEVSRWRKSLFPIHRDGFHQTVVTHEGKTDICVALNNFDDRANSGYEIRNLAGLAVKMPSEEAWTLCTTQNRRYYASGQTELPQPFKIFRSESRQVVASFPGFDRKTNELMVLGDWNPANEELIAIERRDNGNELQSVAILRLSDSKALKRMRTNAYTWTPNGKFIVYFDGGKFSFERIVP